MIDEANWKNHEPDPDPGTEEIARLGKTIPDFSPGDTVIVSVNVVEGTRKRLRSAYEGVVIAKRNRGINSGLTVRKISTAKVWNVPSKPKLLLRKIEVKRRGDVRRAKLHFLP